ncbi:MAG: dihydrolipoamide acetyltransferase family protein [Acidimicrobiales bacterium]|jgi:pyruvate dehydrogenase E2 component (dihydrolipoamide acetyltransferase)
MPDVLMPQLGETVTEGTITQWFKQVGDTVAIDEMLFEVSTDKVDSEVPSPVAGVITGILVAEGETVDVGTPLATVGDSAAAPAPAPAAAAPASAAVPPPAPLPPVVEQPAAATPPTPPPAPAPVAGSPSTESDGRLLSPVVRRLIREHNLEPDSITGTGIGGRITRKDVLDTIDTQAQSAPAQEPAPTAEPARAAPQAPLAAVSIAPVAVAASTAPAVVDDGNYIPFNNIRRRTAEHMVHTVTVAPHAMTVMEIDYEGVEQARKAHKAKWKTDEGFSLTYLPFIIRAVADALADWPLLNASVEGSGLRVHRDINIGVAVDLDNEGLIVPVLRQTDGLRMRAIARNTNDLAARARSRKLGVDDISGGTFTISNNGSFGTFSTFALINQPQVAVLSTDGISRRPVVVTDRYDNESIAIHSVGMLAMGWDHRAFDGGYAGGFLRQVKEIIETRNWETEF